MNVYEKLQTVQSELKAPKNQYNKFGSYFYRNCEDIQEAAKPLLRNVKAALVVGDELVMIGERYYIKATAKFVDCESGETIENTSYAREELEKKGMDVSQVTGSTSSYARKYALNGLFCIDDVKDMDSQNDNAKKTTGNKAAKPNANRARDTGRKLEATAAEPGESTPKITQKEIEDIQTQVGKYSAKGLKMEKILKMYQIKSIADMSMGQYEDCMKKLKLYEEKGETGT